MQLVLDAAVILKFVLVENEPNQQIALDIIKNFQENKVDIVLPNLWVFEVGNTLIRKSRDFENLYKFVLDIGFSTYDFKSSELVEVGKFAKDHNISFYDAAYHFLARLTGSVFVTADEKYFEKVKDTKNVQLLKNLKLSS